jgi:hypothetical protein
VEDAKRVAAARHADVIVPQFWHLPPEHDDTIGWRGAGWTTLQSHGHNHGVDLALDPDFMTSMYRRAGFSPGELRELPLVFDRRSPHREAELLRKVRGDVKKPLLLYNFTGVSSPFPATPEVINPILHRLAGRFHFVNLGLVRAHRIFDLLGIYDVAAGLLTSDTSTLHLAHASPLPYVAFTQNGWTGAIPRGNCALEIKYSDARANAREVLAWASSL